MKNSIVCLFDILGSKNIYYSDDIEKYFNTITNIKEHVRDFIENHNNKNNNEYAQVEFYSFSDTFIIAFVFKDEYDLYFENFIKHFNQFILGVFKYFLAEQFLIRGAISNGKIEIRDGHFIGPVISDVVEYYEKMELVGICLTPKSTIQMMNLIQNNYFGLGNDKFLVKYNTPLKGGINIELFLIDWVDHFIIEFRKNPEKNNPIGSFTNYIKNKNIPIEAINKINNTFKFFKDVLILNNISI